jgi:5-formyltetrahydrofolate cyclo-ligase
MALSSLLIDEKRSLRRVMRERRAALPADERARAAAAGCARLAALAALGAPAVAGGRVVAGFVAKGAEIDPAAALDEVRRRGARVALPRVSDTARPRLRFHLARPGEPLVPGRFGIPEPDPAAPEVALGDVAVMIVPGLAFDAGGGRLGAGGGYYDELLAERTAPPPVLVGFGFDFQVVERCPAEARDRRVDWVVTDARASEATR